MLAKADDESPPQQPQQLNKRGLIELMTRSLKFLKQSPACFDAIDLL